MTVAASRRAITEWNGRLGALRLPDVEEPPLDGPLSDLAISVKDVIDVRGWRVTGNHRPFADRRADRDAPVVAALRAAGACLMGTSTTLEFAYGGFTEDGLYPPARNPWDLARSPGGSSAGAGAAVAAGLCDAALATDTSGSVRGPAALCGVLGLKPGHGAVSNEGIFPLADSLNVAGVLARDPQVLARVLTPMLGRPVEATPATPRRIGWLRGFGADAGVTPVVARAMGRALDDFARAGAEVVEATPAHSLQEYHAACIVSLLYEAWAAHGERLRTEREGYDPRTWARLALGAFVNREAYDDAMALRAILRTEIDGLLAGADLLVTAGAPAPAGDPGAAPPFGMLRDRFLAAPFSATGHPAMTMPIGFCDDSGLPLSLQAVSRFGEESRLVGLAALHRTLRPWQTMRPPFEKEPVA